MTLSLLIFVDHSFSIIMPAPAGNKYSLGRRSKYLPAFDEQARKLCLLGATDVELADFFGVHEDTINAWKKAHLSFSGSITRGKLLADAEIADSLYNRAKGYSHPDTHFSSYEGEVTATETTKYYPPDTQAASLWLRNRQPKKWRDKIDHELTGKDGGPIEQTLDVKNLSTDQLRAIVKGNE